MIKLENVNKYFYRHKKNEIHVINNTSLSLNDKGLVSLLGPSGCGKTTLLNAIGGLDKIDSGSIFVNGKKINSRFTSKIDKNRNLNIGYIFQDYNLIENMTVFDNVALSLKLIGVKDKNEIKRRVEYVLEKVNMYKHRNRFASMLSGGERQRVGIARAIVKNPSIIIADEPTGNLDSKNTIEVMNIIKTISKDRLVILVTHERELADFYSDRILEIEDGVIVNDRKNKHNNDLDYKMDSKIYLKDFKYKNKVVNSGKNLSINYYSDSKAKMEINLVVMNGNIYIESKNNNDIEVINDNSIELVDDHYKKISKKEMENFDFDLEEFTGKRKYTSIFNPISLLINGFKKVRDYSFVKKLLFIGFFLSGMFIFYSASSYFGIQRVDESNFLRFNRNYLIINNEKNKVKDVLELEKDEDIDYVIPGSSMISLNMKFDDYLQTSEDSILLEGSLSSINLVTKEDIIYGRLPENNKEIVIDSMIFDNVYNYSNASSAGILKPTDLLDREVYIYVNDSDEILTYRIVGMVSMNCPCIYTYNIEFNKIIYYVGKSFEENDLYDYLTIAGKFRVTKGRLPSNDYEVIISDKYIEDYKINNTIEYKVNDTKLKIVGFYSSDSLYESYIVNANTIKYQTILENKGLMIYTKDKDHLIEKYKSTYKMRDAYTYYRNKYISEKKESTNAVITTSIIFLVISLIEIYLMMRSSFLSRIKEVGIYRAIGVKKWDIYRMFESEIIFITTFSSLLGVLLMSYILYEISFIPSISDKFLVNVPIVLGSIIFVYVFNLIIGLLPVYKTIRKTPAQILSRTDI